MARHSFLIRTIAGSNPAFLKINLYTKVSVLFKISKI